MRFQDTVRIDPDLIVLSLPLLLFIAAAVHIWRRWSGRWQFATLAPISAFVIASDALKPFWWHSRAWSGYESAFLRYPLALLGGALISGLLVLAHAAAGGQANE